MAFSNAVKYMVDVDAKGAVTGIKAAADAADGGAGKFKAFDTVLQGVQLGMGLDIWGTFKGVLQNAVAALPALIQRTGEYAGQLLKTESSLRLSAEAQQVLMRAGKDAGIAWESQTTAIRKMQNELAKSPEQVKSIGLSWNDLKALAPEKQYEAIGKAVAGIEDPIRRTQAATQFFGKTGTEVLGLFGGAIEQARAANEKFALSMDTGTAQSVDRLSDNIELGGEALDGWGRNFVGSIAASEPLQLVVEGILDVIGYLSREIKANEGTIKQWVSIGVIAALNALMMLTPAIGWVIDGLTGLEIGLAAGLKMFKDVAAGAVFMATAITNPIDASKKLAATLKANAKEYEDSIGAAMKANAEWQGKLAAGTGVLSTFTDKIEASAGSTTKATGAAKTYTSATDGLSAATTKAAKAQEDLAKKLGFVAQAKAEAEIKAILDTVNKLSNGLQTLTAEQLAKTIKALEALGPAGEEAAVGLAAAAAATELIKKNVVSFDGAAERGTDALDEITVSAADYGATLDAVGGFQATFEAELERGAEAAEATTQALKDIAAAAKHSGNEQADAAKKAAAALEKTLDKWRNWGAAIGAVGDLFETMGIKGARILQDVSSAVAVGVENWKAYKEKGLDPAAKAAIVAQGAQTAYNSSVLGGAAAGAAAGAAFGPWGIAIGAVGGALLGWIGTSKRAQEEARKLREEIDRGRETFIEAQGGFEALMARAKEAGYTLDRLFMAKTVQEYNAAVKELTDAFNLQEKAGQALDAAMQKYGITIDQLGPKFSQQKLDAQAMDLYRDWQLLIAAGVDMNLVIEKMSPAMNEYVQTAMRAGATLPESLRPFIQKMIDLGLLTDEAGNKIDSIDKIKFAPTVTQAIQAMTDAIKDLVAALLGIPRETRYRVVRENRTEGGPSDPGGPGEPGPPPPEMAFGGIVAPRPGGTLARVAEAGDAELVAPVRAFSRNLAADLARAVGGGGGSAPAVHIYLDRQTGEARQLTPAEARRIGAAHRAGLIPIPVRTLTARTR